MINEGKQDNEAQIAKLREKISNVKGEVSAKEKEISDLQLKLEKQSIYADTWIWELEIMQRELST